MSDQTNAGSQPKASEHGAKGSLAILILGSIGVVYGDIGTSPLYAMRESVRTASENGLMRHEVLGIVSLLLWTLILIVTVKYVILIMRADNHGEGGTLSLVALIQQSFAKRPAWLIGIGMVGISLFFGDAMITPAMSVLSAVEGMVLVAPNFEPFVVPVTLTIILILFFVQRFGTAVVSVLFGPIMLVWFFTLGLLGLRHIGDDWAIFSAVNPYHGVLFLIENGHSSLIVMGSVFLAVTGGEALYADMGHFGRRPIRIAWSALVFPSLMLSYLGQGAMVLGHPERAENPFFLMAPDWALLPLVILAFFAAFLGFINVPKDFPVFGALLGSNAYWLKDFLGQMLLEKEKAPAFNIIPVLASIGIAITGLGVGALVYAAKPLKAGQTDPVEKLGGVFTFLHNRMYFDELYRSVFINPLQWIADHYTAIVDRGIIDSLLEIGYTIGGGVAEGFKLFDKYVVTGASDLTGSVFKRAGEWVRELQTGQVQNYLLTGIALAAVLVAFYLFIFQG
jgi:hypothetical protein